MSTSEGRMDRKKSVKSKKVKKLHRNKEENYQTTKDDSKVEKKKTIGAKKKKKQHKPKQENDQTNKETTIDNSVFAVTERLLQNKKAEKEKKQLEGKQKTKTVIKMKKAEQLKELQKFFQEECDTSEMTRKSKPNWFESKVKTLVTGYLVSVENYKNNPTPQIKVIKKQNEKKLYRFFLKLSKQLGEDIEVIKHWFHNSKKDILKTGTLSKPDLEENGVLKISILNRKIRAISKETSICPVPKSNDVPEWYDEEFAKLLKVRNKAKRLFKDNPTEENQTAYRQAFKNVKKELLKRKKCSNDYKKPKGKNFGAKKDKTNKSFVSKHLKSNHETPSVDNMTPTFKGRSDFGISTNSNRKHIKFDD